MSGDDASRLDDAGLRQRVAALTALQRACALCPRRCGVDRTRERGWCGQPAELVVAVACAHRGEEPGLVGGAGAGTIFVGGCTLRCRFCQNHQLSHDPPRPAWSCTPPELADELLRLERAGCSNIEWVSPTQHLPGLVEALRLARAAGLRLPVVHNGNGYERVTVVRLLAGIVDVWLPDAKYATDDLARRLSGAPAGYVAQSRRALVAMWHQSGPLVLDAAGRARRGVLLRHLVLPGEVRQTAAVLRWIGETLGGEAWVSLLAQYWPAHEAAALGGALHRPLTRREYRLAQAAMAAAGLERGWVQELSAGACFRPDFDRPDPFAERASAASEDAR